MDNVLRYGWVLGGFLEADSGKEARYNYCEKHRQNWTRHNEIVRKEFNLRFSKRFEVKNDLSEDAYVKIIRIHDKTVISIYIEANRIALVEGIPSGVYEIAFATGSRFSRGCDSFSLRGTAKRFAEKFDFNNQIEGWTVTLYSVGNGNVRANSISYDDFDKI